MAEFKKLGLSKILNLNKFLINFLHLEKFLRLLKLTEFLIILPPLPLSNLSFLFTTTVWVKLFNNLAIKLILSLKLNKVATLLMLVALARF